MDSNLFVLRLGGMMSMVRRCLSDMVHVREPQRSCLRMVDAPASERTYSHFNSLGV